MLLCTSWKMRQNSPEAINRMMSIWGKIEAEQGQHSGIERLCWYSYADGSGGFTISRVDDDAEAQAFAFETTLALGEFLEFETRPVHDLETAMPAIMAAVERMNA